MLKSTNSPVGRWISVVPLLSVVLGALFARGSETPGTYHAWWSQRFSEAERYGAGLPHADPDGDGVSNLAEHLFGGNPWAVDPSLARMVWLGSGRLACGRAEGLIDATYDLQSSFDGVTWGPAAAGDPVLSVTNGRIEAVYAVDLSDPNSHVAFFRMRAGATVPPVAGRDIVCWGDSLTEGLYPGMLGAMFSDGRQVINCGNGSEKSYEICARVRSQQLVFPSSPTNVSPGTILPLRTKRCVPPRTLLEGSRRYWAVDSQRIAETESVEFFVNSQLIGRSDTPVQVDVLTDYAHYPTRLFSVLHPFQEGEEIHFRFTGAPFTCLTNERVYYVVNPMSDWFEIAEFADGEPLDLGGDAAGTVTAIGGFEMPWQCPGGEVVVDIRTHTEWDDHVAIIWAGANNVTQTNTIKASINEMVAHLKPLERRFLVLTILNNAKYPIGTVAHTCAVAVNQWIMETYPSNAVDIRSHLMAHYDPDNPQDLIDVQQDVMPTSLRVDSIHLNSRGNQLVAERLYAEIVARGW